MFEPTKTKLEMYETMRSHFSDACNKTLELKKSNLKMKATEIDHALDGIELPSTLRQEARKLALSRYQDWKKNQKTKGFPSFKNKIAILFNNQNWHLRFDKGYLKVGIPTIEEGNLNIDKYVPVKANEYSLFWVSYLLKNEMDKANRHYQPSYEGISKPKKGNGQLYYKNGKWFFSFSITFEMKQTDKKEKAIGVDRGLRLVAVAGDANSGKYLTFNGRHIGHIRRKFARLRHALQKAKNTKALKRLEDKEQRIIKYWNHVISKKMVRFALSCGACVIKIEDLTSIRSMKKFWKLSDRNINSWAFFDLETKLTYKATLAELRVEKVNPYKTSQECSKCGEIKKSNRRKDTYTCSSCGHKENADINASFNIARRPSIVKEDNSAA
ncbi:RNA-guided endonuclease InsQ/TnpB family protein [Aneurinibacillus tyrosinisolvens]|uniref:RNA-guided endonuclease InsQ/TnpB family protein n=1 Tax=Aneurinibacillus tyrosinisolvens TaxID=1443435 RepID=UPI001379397D|nr:RNA-guided endonuclease TnpB family protein [Aneurinibacillus tyrosinisolvens]